MRLTQAKKHLRLTTKFNILTITLILITAAGICTFIVRSQISHSYNNLVRHGLSITAIIAQNCEYGIYTEDKEYIWQVAKSLVVDDDIAYVCFYKRKQKLICKSFKYEIAMPELNHYRNSLHSLKIRNEEFINEKDGLRYIDIFAPIVSIVNTRSTQAFEDNMRGTHKKIIGYMQLGLTQSGLHKRVHRIIVSTMVFTFVCVIVGVAVTIFLTKRITSPIRELNVATWKISLGILGQRIDIKSHDEISELAKSFNYMLEQLRAYRSQVEERTNELTGANRIMANEIAERQRTERMLEQKTKELSRSNSELEQFAYIVSHDLQEPLRKVMAFGERLITKCGETISNDGKEYVERMQSASERMKTLITDLLAYSRVKTKAQPFTQVDLGKVAQEVLSDLEVKIEKTGGCVKIGDLPTIEADPLQMRQLFQNLIGNALKFHRKDESPVVEVQASIMECQDKKNKYLHTRLCQITVEDNGIGFDEKYAERIFGIFQRLHGRDEYEGTGIGLAICQKIAERHGGDIKAKSALGKGAKFIITLPMKQQKGEDNG